jgi:predicted permease
MAWLHGLTHQLTRLFSRGRVEHDLDEEIRYHLERDIERRIAAGEPEADARRGAQMRFGAVENIKEQVRDETGVRWIEDFVQDVRYGLRGLRRTPVFTAAALISLTVGIGANTAVFSVINGVLMRPLPYPDQDRLQYLQVEWRDFKGPLSDADFLQVEAQQERFGPVVGYSPTSFTLATPDGPVAVAGAWTTHQLVDVFDINPFLGRGFLPDDEFVVLVSYEYWQTRYGGAGDALGRSLDLDGSSYRIIGVMPPGFSLPRQEEGHVWMLRSIAEPPRRGPFYIRAVARTAEGLPPRDTRDLLRAVEVDVRTRYAASAGEWQYAATPLKEVIVGSLDAAFHGSEEDRVIGARTLTVLMAVVFCVLLIAVANVINLLLARGAMREREVAMRTALGARRGRLVRQLLTESAILGLVGGVGGLVLAAGVVELIIANGASLVPRLDEVTIDARVLGFALLLGTAAGLIAGLVPALTFKHGRMTDVLKEGGRVGTGGRPRGATRHALVVGEFALTLTVLIVSALLVKSLVKLQHADIGIEAADVVTFRLFLPDDPYSQQQEFNTVLTALERRLGAIPGVQDVGFTTSLPPNRLSMTNNYVIEGGALDPAGYQPTAEWVFASHGYFDALQIRQARGRTVGESDRFDDPGVIAVNEAFARRHYPDRDPIGRRVQSGNFDPEGNWLTIVGVVGDVVYEAGAAGGVNPTVYGPLSQAPQWYQAFYAVVRTTGDPEALVPALRAAVADVEPRVPLRSISTMDELVRGSTAAERFRSALFTALALLALMLAATGVYGVVSYNVTSAQRDTAIQRAMGASNIRVFRNVLRQGLVLATLGAGLGLAGAGIFSRMMRALLYDVSATDLAVYSGAVLAMLGVAVLACLLPSIRASRTDPMVVLREE